jgi:hypothetical protein
VSISFCFKSEVSTKVALAVREYPQITAAALAESQISTNKAELPFCDPSLG